MFSSFVALIISSSGQDIFKCPAERKAVAVACKFSDPPKMTTKQVIEAINNFTPLNDDDPQNDNESFLRELMTELKTNDDAHCAIEPMFKLIEKYPLVDFGSPGPLVHTLESFPGQYESCLFESLNRRPTPITVWMFNRIINGEPNILIRQNLVDRLQALLTHHDIDSQTTAAINGFVDYQLKILSGS